MRPRRILPCLLLLATVLRADVSLAPLFQDHAVLQRDQPVPVWGRAAPGERVEVAFAGHQVATTAGEDGRWRAELPAMPARAEPAELIVRGRTELRRRDVLVGDVWLLSGQSNMEWPVRASANAEAEIAQARDAGIRHFKTERALAHEPQAEAAGSWAVASPETAGHFSAVGYFFARELRAALDVPIGLVNSTWGGTPVESWLPPRALAAYPTRRLAVDHHATTLAGMRRALGQHEAALAAWASEGATPPAPTEPWTPGPEIAPGVLYNAMVAPHVPAALRGVLWYQGEGNADQPETYAPMFATLIESWRQHFRQPDLPFYWVQLANWDRSNALGTNWARLRDAQTATLRLPHTGQAVAIDIGDPDDIHPTNKQDVGRRLARIALAQVHDQPADFRGPTFAGLRVSDGAARVAFEHAEGLTTRDGAPPQGFELAGLDQVFHPAEAAIEGPGVTVRSRAVPAPVAVRYAWRNCPVATLQNGAGLPAVPFRSDDWPVER